MSRKFIAAIAGTAIAVTAFGTAPARADDDLFRALATIAGIAIVGKVIKDRLDEDNNGVVYRNDYYYPYVYTPPRNNNVTRRVEPRSLPRSVQRRLLPGDCLRSWNTSDGRARVFGKRCLQKNYAYNNSLPRSCEVKLRVNNKKLKGYDARCLRREGYQLARR